MLDQTLQFIGDLSLAENPATPGLPRFNILAYSGGVASMPHLRLLDPNSEAGQAMASLQDRIVIDVETLKIQPDPLTLRLDHDPTKPLGHGVARKTPSQVFIDGVFSVPGQDANKVVGSYANKFPWKASIGLSGGRYFIVKDGESVQVNGRAMGGPLALFSGCTLTEVSIVDRGADPNTQVQIQMKECPMPVDPAANPAPVIEPVAAEPAKQSGSLSAAQLSAAHAALNATPIKDAAERDAYIVGLADGKYGSVGEMKLAAMEKSFEKGGFAPPAPIKPGDAPYVAGVKPDASMEIISAAFAEHCSMADHLKPEIREKAERLAKPYGSRGLSLQGAILAMAAARGESAHRIGGSNFGRIMAAAFSGSSTVDAPNVLADTVQRKAMLVYQSELDTVAKTISISKSLNDFRPHSMAGAYGDVRFLPVNENGQVAHAVTKDQAYTVRATTEGRTLVLSRAMVINDDTGALMDYAARLGEGAGQAVNAKVWALWATTKTGGAHWTSGQGNYSSGGGSALGSAGLTTAVTKLAKIKRPTVNGRSEPMSQRAKYLLVPSELEATAKGLYASSELKGSTDGVVTNIHAGQYIPLSTPFLSDADYVNDTAGWYLLVDPAKNPTLIIGYLNGVEGPTITQNLNVHGPIEGIGWTGFLDYGVTMGEPLASVLSAGA